jgi:prepilin-type N-terminal cleavage/methylation domain-containing protein
MNFYKSKKGFTLVEMLVVISIITIITTVVISGQSKYSLRLNLFAQGYKALTYIRQAQVYGLGVKADPTGNFDASYGVSFDFYANDRFTYFIDKNIPGNIKGRMDIGEEVETVLLEGGVTIQSIAAGGCSAAPIGTARVDISFNRPNPKANLHVIEDGGAECSHNSGGFVRLITIGLPFNLALININIDTFGYGSVTPYIGGGQ